MEIEPQAKGPAMDLSVDGENLELNQQVKEFRIVISLLRQVTNDMLNAKRSDPHLERPETAATLATLRGRLSDQSGVTQTDC